MSIMIDSLLSLLTAFRAPECFSADQGDEADSNGGSLVSAASDVYSAAVLIG